MTQILPYVTCWLGCLVLSYVLCDMLIRVRDKRPIHDSPFAFGFAGALFAALVSAAFIGASIQ